MIKISTKTRFFVPVSKNFAGRVADAKEPINLSGNLAAYNLRRASIDARNMPGAASVLEIVCDKSVAQRIVSSKNIGENGIYLGSVNGEILPEYVHRVHKPVIVRSRRRPVLEYL